MSKSNKLFKWVNYNDNNNSDKGLILCLNRDFTRTLKFVYTFESYKWYHIYFELEGIYNI